MQIYACFIRSESMMITQAFSPQLIFLSTFLKNGKIFLVMGTREQVCVFNAHIAFLTPK